MGRRLPEVQLSQDIREEVELARAVEQAVARVAPAPLADATDTETAAVVEQVLTQLDATAGGPAPAAAPASRCRCHGPPCRSCSSTRSR